MDILVCFRQRLDLLFDVVLLLPQLDMHDTWPLVTLMVNFKYGKCLDTATLQLT